MPLIAPSTYRPPLLFGNGHLQTIYPSLFRRVNGVRYRRERIYTPDDDFLDLDWSRVGSDKLAIISHGLEGNSHRAYVLGMVRAVNRAGWDALAWNYRGCSGEPNRLLRSYHSGATEDLHTVVEHARSLKLYREIALIGFSLGGNLTLKYGGERGEDIPPEVTRLVAISTPCDLASSARKMARPENRIYMIRFMRMLREKIRQKKQLMPGLISDEDFDKIRTFEDFDSRYTAPLHGFADAEDYWQKCSSRQFIPGITVPTLLINARNDPFLAPECYPIPEAEQHPLFFLEMPESGGHVGFISFNSGGIYWSERRTVAFLTGEPCTIT